MKSLDYVKQFNSVIPLDTAEFIQNNYSNLTDPLRNKVARPPNFGGHFELVSLFKFSIKNNKRWKYLNLLPEVPPKVGSGYPFGEHFIYFFRSVIPMPPQRADCPIFAPKTNVRTIPSMGRFARCVIYDMCFAELFIRASCWCKQSARRRSLRAFQPSCR